MQKLGIFLDRLEKSILFVLIFTMLLFATLDLFLRYFNLGSFTWVAPFLKISVLWITMLGGLLAAKSDEHIKVDLINKLVKNSKIVDVIPRLFTAFIAFVLTIPSYYLVQMSFEFGDKFFNKIPLWIMLIIMPLSFFLIGLRYLLLAFERIKEKDEN